MLFYIFFLDFFLLFYFFVNNIIYKHFFLLKPAQPNKKIPIDHEIKIWKKKYTLYVVFFVVQFNVLFFFGTWEVIFVFRNANITIISY